MKIIRPVGGLGRGTGTGTCMILGSVARTGDHSLFRHILGIYFLLWVQKRRESCAAHVRLPTLPPTSSTKMWGMNWNTKKINLWLPTSRFLHRKGDQGCSYPHIIVRPYKMGKEQLIVLASDCVGNVIVGSGWENDRIIPDCIRVFRQSETVYPQSACYPTVAACTGTVAWILAIGTKIIGGGLIHHEAD